MAESRHCSIYRHPTTPRQPHPPWDGNPPAHPHKLRPGRGRRVPPGSLTQTPPLLRAFVVAPEQLPHPAHPPGAPPSSEPPWDGPACVSRLSHGADGNVPPQIGSAQAARRTAPTRASSGLVVDGNLPPGSLTQTPPSPASPRGSAGAALARPPHPPPSSSVAAAIVWTATFPRRSAPRKLLAELLPPSLCSASSRTATFHPTRPGGTRRRLRPCRPPFLRRRPPNPRPPALFHFPRPRAPQRAVAFRTFPPPYGPGAARPWLRRGRRKRRSGVPVSAPYPNPALRATPRLRAAPLHKRGLCQTRRGHLPGPPPDASREFSGSTLRGPPPKQGPAAWLRVRSAKLPSSFWFPPTRPLPPPTHPPPTPRRRVLARCARAAFGVSCSSAPAAAPPAHRALSKPPSSGCFSTRVKTRKRTRSTSTKRKPGGLLLASKNGTGFVFP